MEQQFKVKRGEWEKEIKAREGTSKSEAMVSKTAPPVASSKGKQEALVPVDQSLKGKTNRVKGNFFATMRDVDRALNSNCMLVLLIFKEYLFTNEELPSNLPLQVKSLLQEFEDIFPEELPQGLPPIRGIEHQIDLIPGAAIPNHVAYRANPEETKEFQR